VSSAEPALHRTRPADLFLVARRLLLSHNHSAAGPVSISFGRRRAHRMALRVSKTCPGCGLILLYGSLPSAQLDDRHGPILGIHPEARPETARAGYVGISSLWTPEMWPESRVFYRCPRCRTDPLVEVPEDADLTKPGAAPDTGRR
jgi:hypothetical protein